MWHWIFIMNLHLPSFVKNWSHTKPESLIIFFHFPSCFEDPKPSYTVKSPLVATVEAKSQTSITHSRVLITRERSADQSDVCGTPGREELMESHPSHHQYSDNRTGCISLCLSAFLFLSLASFLVESGAKSQLSSVSMLSLERRMCFLWPQFTC